jgi:hypothetical protein
VKFMSRILEGLMARRGLVEPREGIGLAFLYWVVVAAVEASVEEEERKRPPTEAAPSKGLVSPPEPSTGDMCGGGEAQAAAQS